MHVDINSCFATIEQQANPFLRGKPTVVAAYTTGNGCILAASREAKLLGIKTGMRVSEGKNLYPRLAVLPSNPDTYRWVNQKLHSILSSYTPRISIESIDEMVMDLVGAPSSIHADVITSMQRVACEIKDRIKQEIGSWMTVSIGIAPNRYLAKVASGLHKPDGLDVITLDSLESIFQTIQLEDLCGIKYGISRRLRAAGIQTPVDLLRATPERLISALHSKTGFSWWQRLHGYEDGVIYKAFDSQQDVQKTYGQSFALGKPRSALDPEILKSMTQLLLKMDRRLRKAGYAAHGINISLSFIDHTHWTKNIRTTESLFSDTDFLHYARRLLGLAPDKLIRIMAVTSFNLFPEDTGQISLWNADEKKRNVTNALDAIADRWGEYTVTPATMMHVEQKVLDRIAFGKT
ncbi:hypothetical protein HY948_01575 [Candidatus Gottesmanbacteria bacterium]|nr:hypothetical protein [Candidatus Gottesmanbacteria bacterium]